MQNSRMNIVYVCAYSDNITGGVRSVVPQYLKYMSRVANVYIFSYRKIKFYCSQDKYYQINTQKELRKKLRIIDIVVFHEVYYFEYYLLANYLHRSKVPYIVIPHCSLTTGAQKQKKHIKKIINKFWVDNFIRQALAVQYLSDCEKEASKAFETKTLVIPNGIIASHMGTKRYYDHNSVEFVFIGRLSVNQKGLDVLVEACQLIKNKLIENNVHINLYGTDFEGGKNYLQKKIRKYGLESHVLMHAPVYGDDKQRVLLQSDVYILTSRFEGLPIGILEAMQAGIPVLVTPGSGFYEVVKKENCGWCTECYPDAIADAVLKVLEQRNQWESMSVNAVWTVNSYYVWDKVAAMTKQKYEKLLWTNIRE